MPEVRAQSTQGHFKDSMPSSGRPDVAVQVGAASAADLFISLFATFAIF